MRKPAFCISEKQRRRSAAITAQLISAFVFATKIVQSLFFLNPKFQVSSHLLVCTACFVLDLVGNPEDRFSHDAAYRRLLQLNRLLGVHLLNALS